MARRWSQEQTEDFRTAYTQATSEYQRLVHQLKQARRSRRISQAALAEKLDIAVRQISNFERCEEMPNGVWITLYATAIGVKLNFQVIDPPAPMGL